MDYSDLLRLFHSFRFIVREPGLTGETNTVSFEAADFPGNIVCYCFAFLVMSLVS